MISKIDPKTGPQRNLTGQEREALWAELGLKKKSKQLSVAERGEE